MKKVIGNIFVTIYVLIAIFTTVCLLSYNEYKISEFGNNAIILVTNDELNPEYNKGDLVIVNIANKNKIAVGDKIFFYKQNTLDKTIDVTLATVEKKEVVTSTETTFTVEGDYPVSSTYVIGASKNTTVIPKLGTVLSILESKWGFLFLIVLPSLIAFIYEITVVFGEIREAKKESK